MLDFYLANQRQSLRVTLLGGVGDSLILKKTSHVGMCSIVLTLISAKTYNNKLYLSSTSLTVIYDNDDIPSLQELKLVISLVEPNKEMMVVDCSQPREGTVENLLMWARNCKNDTVTFHYGDLSLYRLEVVVVDDIAHTIVVMFNEIATKLLNYSADCLIEAKDEFGLCYLFQPHSYIDTNLYIHFVEEDSGLPTAIRNLIGTTHVMELKSHTYYKYGSYESFTCWKINPADLVDDRASSSNQLIDVDDSEKSFKRLERQPSVSEAEESNTNEMLCLTKDPHEINADGPMDKKKRKMHLNEDSDSAYLPLFHHLTINSKKEWNHAMREGDYSNNIFVDAYIAVEEQRLKWTRNNQDMLRVVLYHNLCDIVTRGDTSATGLEFQKRGLPHAHILLWLEEHSKCRTPSEINDIISAELPSPTDDPTGYQVVIEKDGEDFLYQTIIDELRSERRIVLVVASSGIASLPLPAGRTAYNRFVIPLDLMDNSTCGIKQNIPLVELMQEVQLIIWDEAPMTQRYAFKALDITLRDILEFKNTEKRNQIFEGMTVLLGGDFRQILPVIPKAKRPEIVLAVGDGTLPAKIKEGEDEPTWINIPKKFLIKSWDSPIQQIVTKTYPDFTSKQTDDEYRKERAIITPRNDDAKAINEFMFKHLSGEPVTYYSADEIYKASTDNIDQHQLYPIEFLNSLNFPVTPEVNNKDHALMLQKMPLPYGLDQSPPSSYQAVEEI
nr:ATP-dependent DNA helicase PIF1-like [Tanacetum cinerariifolium]